METTSEILDTNGDEGEDQDPYYLGEWYEPKQVSNTDAPVKGGNETKFNDILVYVLVIFVIFMLFRVKK